MLLSCFAYLKCGWRIEYFSRHLFSSINSFLKLIRFHDKLYVLEIYSKAIRLLSCWEFILLKQHSITSQKQQQKRQQVQLKLEIIRQSCDSFYNHQTLIIQTQKRLYFQVYNFYYATPCEILVNAKWTNMKLHL